MEKLGRKIVRFRIPIFIIGLLLLIPSVFGYINTRVNYDVLYYLPDSIETMQGQDILVDEFGTGAYSMFICEGMENKDVAKLKEQIEDVEHVSKVVWYDSFADISIPMEMLPEDIREAFNADDSTLMFIIFDTTTSADETMDAIENITRIGGYILLFSILFSLAEQIPGLPLSARLFLLPSLEMTTGVRYICSLELPFPVRYASAAFLTSFGGFCCLAQTASILKGTPLEIMPYFAEKLVTAAATSFLSCLFLLIF